MRIEDCREVPKGLDWTGLDCLNAEQGNLFEVSSSPFFFSFFSFSIPRRRKGYQESIRGLLKP